MIIDLSKTEQYIIDWIKNYASAAGIKTLIVGLSGGVDSALVALLCTKTSIPTVCVAMPCHSSTSSLNRAKEFTSAYDLKLLTVDLAAVNNNIIEQLKSDIKENLTAVGGLRSCLRAPTLSYIALSMKGLIIGTGNRSEDKLIRYFQKFGDGCVDICPISDLFKSEVYELFAHMTQLNSPAAVNIYNATPTADLWGPDIIHEDELEIGLKYDEIEWGDRQNTNNNIITDMTDPVRNPAWHSYTSRQRQIICKMHALEKASRHKYNPNLPICQLRSINGYVK